MIWIDLDNSPHVPLFRPIIAGLQARGKSVFVTSRAHAQTQSLLEMWNIPHLCVGRHGGKSRVGKVLNLLERSRQLRRAVRPRQVTLAVSHGSRAQLLAAASLGIRTLIMDDYEFSDQMLTRHFATAVLVPDAIPEERLVEAGIPAARLMRYGGFKEEIYLPLFEPDPCLRERLGIGEDLVLVVMRPPSVTANYHDVASERLFRQCLDRFCTSPSVLCLIVKRTEADLRLLPDRWLKAGVARVLHQAVDGLQLIWAADLVVGGGGTMNREAALLGIPTYSIFTGRRAAVDERLASEGLLRFVEQAGDVQAIPLAKRARKAPRSRPGRALAERVTDLILDFYARAT